MKTELFMVKKLPRAGRFILQGDGHAAAVSLPERLPDRVIAEEMEITRALPHVKAEAFSFRVERGTAGFGRVPFLSLVPETAPGVRPPLLMFVHGFETSKEKVLRYGVHFAAAGYYTVLPDLPFHGERRPSDFESRFDVGRGSREGWRNRLELIRRSFTEVRSLLNRLLDSREIDPERAGISGVSMGGTVALLCSCAEPRLKAAAPFLGVVDLVESAGPGRLSLSPLEEAGVRRLDPLYAIESRPAAAILAQYGTDDPITSAGLLARFEARMKSLYAETPELFRLIRHPGVAHQVSQPMIDNALEWLGRFL